MQRVHPRFWTWALGAYPACGFLFGVGWLHTLAERLLGRAGIGTFVGVNLLMPMAAVAIGAAYPRLRTALPGAALLTLGWISARMFYMEPRFWLWDWNLFESKLHPILIAATIGYAVIGALTAAVTRTVRQVGIEHDGPICAACGYSLTGLRDERCPECGQRTTDVVLSSPGPTGGGVTRPCE